MIEYVLWLLAGTMYGTVIGVIPIAGATIGLLAVFGMIDNFLVNPYLGVVFMTSFLGAVSSSDSYTSILTGIPGGGSTAASVIDGHPLAKQGQAGRAIGAALLDSTINGVFWGALSFGLLPFYGKLIMYFGIPEFAALMLVSIICVGFITVKNPVLSVASILLGLFLGLIGQDPGTGAHRFTFGWEYLAAGIQVVPMIAGLFAIPEIISCVVEKNSRPSPITNYWKQLFSGFRDVAVYWKDTVRGGVIGFVTGVIPGVGGSVGDMIAYGLTVAVHKNEKFGNGNIRGLIGCEGANNAQKPASLIPTIVFGIPAAPFAVIFLAVCTSLGLDLGTTQLLNDSKFVYSVALGFTLSTIIGFILCIFITKLVVKILTVPIWVYAIMISFIVIWSSFQYSGTLDDLYILMICGAVGMACKYSGFSRPAVLLCYIIAIKFENYSQQALTLYSFNEIISRPIVQGLLVVAALLIFMNIRNFTRKK
jgi:putative tricarboxylic transport membrane protein